MKFVCIVLLTLTGCASERLMRCPTDFEDTSVNVCEKSLGGDFFMCQPHPPLKRCVEAK